MSNQQQQPQNIRIPPPSFDAITRPLFTPQGVTHSPGSHVPPALSPLDAFAMQGRLLQKRFEEQQMAGHRLSRLPPTTIAFEFAKPRPDFFRTMTEVSLGTQSAPGGSVEDEGGPFGNLLEIKSGPRPKSHYPQMGHSDYAQPTLPLSSPYEAHLLEFVREAAQQKAQAAQNTRDWNNLQQSTLSDDMDATPLAEAASNPWSRSPPLPYSHPQHNGSSAPDLLQNLPGHPFTSSNQVATSVSKLRNNGSNLDESSHLSVARTSSVTSNERPSPPRNQHEFTFPRSPKSPSLTSVRSVASAATRPSFNFSRPLSRQSRPSIDSNRVTETPYRSISIPRATRHPLDMIYRQDSVETPSAPFSSDTPQTPTSMASEELNTLRESKADSTPSSFVYKKYTLAPPKQEFRRVSARASVGLEEFISSQFNWDGSSLESNLDLQLSAPFVRPQSPPSPIQTVSESRRRNKPSELLLGSLSVSPQASHERTRRRLQKSRPGTSGDDGSDTRSAPPPESPLTMDKVAQEHLDKGVELYQAGNLSESTYHWRLAATAGQGTAMLLYALACRHGWGVKANLPESQLWLQSAVNHSTMQCGELQESFDSQRHSINGAKDIGALFSSNVYELGKTFSNGLGVAKDTTLAMRCFEIAGSWGNGNADAEAAHCYLDGTGVRKDVQRAAKLYRMAESKGVVVPGNNWIHQEKYISSDTGDERLGRGSIREEAKDRSKSKARSKSRTRQLFSRKKSFSTDS